MPYLRQSTAVSVIIGPFLSDASGVTLMTSIEVSVATGVDIYKGVSKTDITTTIAGTNAMAHVANGFYSLAFVASQMNTVGPCTITANFASCLPVWHTYDVLEEDEYDRLFTSTAATITQVKTDTASLLSNIAAVYVDTAILKGYGASSAISINSILSNIAAVYIDTTSTLSNVKLYGASTMIAVSSILSNVAAVYADTAILKDYGASSAISVQSIISSILAVNISEASIISSILSLRVATISILSNVASIQIDTTSLLANIITIKAGTVSAAISLASILSNVASIQVDTTSMLANIMIVEANGASTAIGIASLLSNIANVPDLIWDETMSQHSTVDTAGAKLIAAGSVNDPWIAPLPGSYTAGQAGNILAAISIDTMSLLVNLGMVNAIVDSIKVDTTSVAINIGIIDGNIDNLMSTPAAISALNNLSAAQVNAEIIDVLNVDTFAGPGQEAPAATASLVKKIGYLYKYFRNKRTATSTAISIYNDDEITVDQKILHSDDGNTYTRGETRSGP